MTRFRLTDISPDGVTVRIEWEEFAPGSSIFVPCINTSLAIEQILYVTKWDRNQIDWRVLTENGKYGVRVWRVI